MNVYAVIILSTLLLDYALNLLADCYNLRALRLDLPRREERVHQIRQAAADDRQVQFMADVVDGSVRGDVEDGRPG